MPVCPKCGGELDDDGVCLECGFDPNVADKENWESNEGNWKEN